MYYGVNCAFWNILQSDEVSLRNPFLVFVLFKYLTDKYYTDYLLSSTYLIESRLKGSFFRRKIDYSNDKFKLYLKW